VFLPSGCSFGKKLLIRRLLSRSGRLDRPCAAQGKGVPPPAFQCPSPAAATSEGGCLESIQAESRLCVLVSSLLCLSCAFSSPQNSTFQVGLIAKLRLLVSHAFHTAPRILGLWRVTLTNGNNGPFPKVTGPFCQGAAVSTHTTVQNPSGRQAKAAREMEIDQILPCVKACLRLRTALWTLHTPMGHFFMALHLRGVNSGWTGITSPQQTPPY
jgi:hypothetical protein